MCLGFDEQLTFPLGPTPQKNLHAAVVLVPPSRTTGASAPGAGAVGPRWTASLTGVGRIG